MQPKTSRSISWFGVLAIAIISGLVVKVVGDPVVEVTTPKIENFLEDVEDEVKDFLKEHDLGEKLRDLLERKSKILLSNTSMNLMQDSDEFSKFTDNI